MGTLIAALKKVPFLRSIYRSIVRLTTVPPYRIVVFPTFVEEAELLDVLAKIRYFLPHCLVSRVTVVVNPGISIASENVAPTYISLAVASLPVLVEYLLPTDKLALLRRLICADYILVTDEKRFPRSLFTRLLGTKIVYVDRHEFVWEGWRWATLGHRLTLFEDLTNPKRAQTKFNNYVDALSTYEKAYIFGTGPSLDQAYNFDFSDGYRIVCNTIVKNQRLLEHISPHFIVAADAIYHFGNNKHAYQFRSDLEKALDRTQALFLTVDFFVYLLKYLHPRIFEKTVAVRTDLQGIFLDMKNTLAYTLRPNILNGLLLPLGSSLAQNIYLMGFDGRAPKDRLFWKNSGDNSYEDLKPTIQAAHPGFFKRIDYEEYAQSQSDCAEEIMTIGEGLGKNYYCLHETFIPALRKRLHPAVQASLAVSDDK